MLRGFTPESLASFKLRLAWGTGEADKSIEPLQAKRLSAVEKLKTTDAGLAPPNNLLI
jgi:hypothetical protein